jgi:hypothetical protein
MSDPDDLASFKAFVLGTFGIVMMMDIIQEG